MIAKVIYAFADVMSRPMAFVAITAAFVLATVYGLTTGANNTYMTLLNLSISILTMVIGQAVLVSSSRDNVATHAKLDDIIKGQPGGNDAIGIEHEDETTIKQIKTEIEATAK